jgi:hypothetical protein
VFARWVRAEAEHRARWRGDRNGAMEEEKMAEGNVIAGEQSQIRIPAEEAFISLLAEMDALSEAELLVPTVDVMSAVSIVLGV